MTPRFLRSRPGAALLALALLATGCGSPGGGDSTDEGAVNPDGRRIAFLAVDGMSWRILDPLLEAGQLPNLARLVETGASGELATLTPTQSPIIWTSIATGKSMEKHGIDGFWYEMSGDEAPRSQDEIDYMERLEALGYIGGDRPAGETAMALFHSGKRTTKAFWGILSEAGLSTDVIGWWVSHPVEPIRGRMVSDRYIYNRFELAAEEKNRVYDTTGGHVHPPEIRERLDAIVVPTEEVSPEDMKQFIRGEVELDENLTLHAVEDELRIVYAKDLSFLRISKDMLEENVPDLFAVYLQGADISSHYFWKYGFPDEWDEKFPAEATPPGEIERYSAVVESYYRKIDEWIGELLEAGEATTVIVASDHGFVTGRRGQRSGLAERTISGIHSTGEPPGILIVAGEGIRPGVRFDSANVYDVLPTLLTLLGLPVAEDMDGRILEEALDETVTRRTGDRATIPSYDD